ncbi:hypothetical protein [Deinococcus yavapaiensis]|uniref:Antitoxin VbhA domain-containing protein n=1 Tax=Deinococcus yavapaiensis KR-236 TaxID=694435 RepID=A0A318SE78_9DEIO|nr:hypothetical protein [Deinococcus yavapaiensis]PYE55391.1 hypothetical protein DES52_103224 [Deinococcus yavapaiensis KR-236]
MTVARQKYLEAREAILSAHEHGRMTLLEARERLLALERGKVTQQEAHDRVSAYDRLRYSRAR